MTYLYTAIIYSQEEKIIQKESDNLDELHVWMLTYENGTYCHFSGEIIDNKTQEVVRQFRKSSID